MTGIPEATPIRLTAEERADLEGLARSTKTEYRLRQRARIVLLAADGSRVIGREVGCTTRNGLEVAGALCKRPLCRAGRDRRARRPTQIHGAGRQAHSGGAGQFHFTPTRASLLNQVEIWFSILAGQSLAGASFTSVTQLRAHIDSVIEPYNKNAKPFAWTKSEVHQKRLKARFADQ